MKDKHLKIEAHSELLKTIHKVVKEKLIINAVSTTRKIWIKFAIYFLLTVSSYAALYSVDNPLTFVLSFIIYGFITLLLAFNFSHDFSHNTVFKNRKLNTICYILTYSIVGAHAEAWKQRHVNSHHYAPNVEGYDSDLKISKLIRVIPKSKWFWFHEYQHIYAPFAYTIYSLFWIFIKDFIILFSKDEFTKSKGLKYHLSFWMQKSFYVLLTLVCPLCFSEQAWYVVLIGFFVMHLSLSLFLLFTFFMTHHVENTIYPTVTKDGYISTSWLMNQIRSSNDMHPFSEVANFILGGFNNHIAHHLFPHVHHIHYPKLNKILYDVLGQNDIEPNQTTYFGGVISHLMLLKRMSKA